MNKNITIFILTFLLVLTFLAYFVSNMSGKEIMPPIAPECNMDTQVCPDGSFVGRTGPNCEFSLCPVLEQATSTHATTTEKQATGTVYGKVTLSPICPVESIPPRPECAPKPFVDTDVRIYSPAGKDLDITDKTSSDGSFVFHLFPGTYVIRVITDAIYPRCEEKQVSVIKGTDIQITVFCDTGIR